MQYDIRDVTAEDESFEASQRFPAGTLGVTLTTPKSMEVATMARDDMEMGSRISIPVSQAVPEDMLIPGFYKPELRAALADLPRLLPPVLFVWGRKSDVLKHPTGPGLRHMCLISTGSASCGSGGHAKGRMTKLPVEEASHAVPLEKPALMSSAVVPWLAERTTEWSTRMVGQPERETSMNAARIKPDWLRKIHKL